MIDHHTILLAALRLPPSEMTKVMCVLGGHLTANANAARSFYLAILGEGDDAVPIALTVAIGPVDTARLKAEHVAEEGRNDGSRQTSVDGEEALNLVHQIEAKRRAEGRGSREAH